MEIVPAAVAEAAMKTGVAQRPIENLDEYRTRLRARLNPTTSVLTLAYEAARNNPKRVVFAEGEEEVVLRAAIQFRDGGYGIPVLVGREGLHDKLRAMGVADAESFEVHNRSEEHTSELQSLMRNSYAVFCLKKKNKNR